ncbi:DUF805 domain-containing protein [Succinimonas amylolytica]|uniref:DUF805 domain-containing protein n=1 Tax=Succinimonas amylolytica TaxID=83769 RepID=UPI0003723D18|nr:hypothetical protein [Succinimonas amylolytica]
MTRFYYFLVWVVCTLVIMAVTANAVLGIDQTTLMNAQTPEAMKELLAPSVIMLQSVAFLATVIVLVATAFRLGNANMSKWLTLLMFVPLVNFLFAIFLCIKR